MKADIQQNPKPKILTQAVNLTHSMWYGSTAQICDECVQLRTELLFSPSKEKTGSCIYFSRDGF